MQAVSVGRGNDSGGTGRRVYSWKGCTDERGRDHRRCRAEILQSGALRAGDGGAILADAVGAQTDVCEGLRRKDIKKLPLLSLEPERKYCERAFELLICQRTCREDCVPVGHAEYLL